LPDDLGQIENVSLVNQGGSVLVGLLHQPGAGCYVKGRAEFLFDVEADRLLEKGQAATTFQFDGRFQVAGYQ